MSLMDKAQALERRLRLKPHNVEIIVSVNPCYECSGCKDCERYHQEVNGDQEGRIIIVNGEES